MKHKLQTHFFLTYFFMAMIVVLLFSIFFFQYTSEILIERETKNLQELNNSFLSRTDAELRELDNVSINIAYSSRIKKQLSEWMDVPAASDEFRNLTTLFMSINGTNLNADQINLYDYNGYLLRVGTKTNIYPIDLSTLDWMDEVSKNAGKKTISLPYATNDLKTSGTSSTPPTWYISLYRTLQDSSKEEIGVIETMKKCSSVFKSIITYKKRTKNAPEVYIYDSDGRQVYPYVESEESHIPSDYYSLVSGQPESESLKTWGAEGERELVIHKTSSYTHWTHVIVQDEAQVLLPVRNMLDFLIMVVFLMVGLCLVFSYMTSRQLIKPIRKLKRVIRSTVLDTLDENNKAELSNSFAELEELNQEFADMNVNLKNSMNALLDSRAQELKSRSLALQSQINPHFYYNTLASIIVLAEKERKEEVITICRNLTRMMRYITGSSNAPVTLREEMDYVRKYLYCMKVRFQENLNYTIEVDESILDVPVPKLIIQPIVENALKYGIDCKPPWDISIRSVITEDAWRIEVEDSGTGFSEKALEQIRERIQTADEQPGLPELNIDGLGLLNVYIRWRLHCGEQIIFEYGNTGQHHGIVTIGRCTKAP